MDLRRVSSWPVAGTALRLPCFYPSISSVKTNLRPVDYLEFLVGAGHPLLLISAYDIGNAGTVDRQRITNLLGVAVGSGQTVLLDSGNYESFWKADQSWDVKAFHGILACTPHHLCFCHDNQAPPDTSDAIAQDVVASVLRDQAAAKGTTIPIVHGPAALLPGAVRRVAAELCPAMVAVPERALGNGIVARAAAVQAIRAGLNDVGAYVPLHLLGTGNPVSLLVYALAGADSFDGLEWCQTVVDHRTGRLHHFQHWDLFADQTPVIRDGGLPYVQSVLLHNLTFFRRFMLELGDAISSGDGQPFARKWLSRAEWETVAKAITKGRE